MQFLVVVKFILVFWVFQLSLAGSAGAEVVPVPLSETETAWIATHPVIRVGGESDWAPFDFVDEQGQYIGLASDHLKLISEKTGLQFEVQTGSTWSQLIEKIKRKEIDLLPALYRSKERGKYLKFSDAYLTLTEYAFTRKGEPTVHRFKELYGKRIAVVKGFEIVSWLKEHHPQIIQVPAEDLLGALSLVVSGEAEVFIGDNPSATYNIKKYFLANLQINGAIEERAPVRVYMGVRNDWAVLRQILNKALKSITEAEKHKIHEKWLFDAPDSGVARGVSLSTEERAWLKNNPVIQVGVDPEFAPFGFIDDQGAFQGMAADVINLLQQRLPIKFEIQKNLSWGQVLQGAERQQIDLLACVENVPQYGGFLQYSDPYLSFAQVIVSRSDEPFVGGMTGLVGRKVAVPKGSAHHGFLESHPGVEAVLTSTSIEALNAVAAGNADFAIGNLAAMSYLIQTHHIFNLKIAAPASVQAQQLGFGVRKDWPVLRSILNKGLADISPEELLGIQKKWVAVRYEQRENLSEWAPKVGAGALVFLLLLVGVLYWNRRLHTEVSQRRLAEESMLAAQAEANAANQAKSEFLANMSHEIRSPMNGILGMTQLALKTELNEKQRGYLEKTYFSASNLLRIINDILDFSKIEAGMLEVETIEFNLDQVLKNLSHNLGPLFHGTETDLLFHVEDNVELQVFGDPLRLEQVFVNLISNAAKFTPKGQVILGIQVSKFDEETQWLEICVTDTGIGLSKTQQAKLFQSFSQADSTTTRNYGGTGLGLTISKRLVELMGGEIQLESEPGVGSRFFFTVPLGYKQSARQTESAECSIEHKRILVVDPAPDSLQTVKKALEGCDCTFVSASTGEEGVKVVKAQPEGSEFDLLIAEHHLAGLDGLQLCQYVLGELQLSKLPKVILLTNEKDLVFEELRQTYGVSGVLAKPVTISMFKEELVAVYDDKGATKAQTSMEQAVQTYGAQYFAGRQALVAEDNLINQEIIEELLRSVGFGVTVVGNGQLAVEAIQKSAFDVLLMDLHMPVLDGYEATQAIRKTGKFDRLPIIALTANAMAGERERCIDIGMDEHASKPIDPKDLFSKIESLMAELKSRNETPVEANALDPAEVVIPPLVGVEVDLAVKRMGGNKKLYLKLLQDMDRYQTDGQKLVRLVEAGDLVDAEHLAHSLKGLFGNLGFVEVQGALEQIEGALAQKLPVPLEGFLKLFEQALGLAATARLEPGPGTPGAEGGLPLIPLLEELQAACKAGNPVKTKQLVEQLDQANWKENELLFKQEIIALVKVFKLKEAEKLINQVKGWVQG